MSLPLNDQLKAPIQLNIVPDSRMHVHRASATYAKALLATPRAQLVEPETAKAFKGVAPEQIARMETETANLQRQIKLIEESYGPDHLNLVLARGYVASLLNNGKIVRYLTQHHGEIQSEFQKILEATSMGSEAAE